LKTPAALLVHVRSCEQAVDVVFVYHMPLWLMFRAPFPSAKAETP
jgi:hypothetical protein